MLINVQYATLLLSTMAHKMKYIIILLKKYGDLELCAMNIKFKTLNDTVNN